MAADDLRADAHAVIEAAAAAFRPWRAFDASTRARALVAVADALAAQSAQLIELARQETNLRDDRLSSELTRTTFQLRFFANLIQEGQLSTGVVDHRDDDWPMGAPRPDLRRHSLPIGPVLVFAASNFPFAFGVAGGDVASALAAGCSVVVKAHSGHPALSNAIAAIITSGLSTAGAPDGVFGIIHGTDEGVRALRHPGIRAASFTGSTTGGRALFDIASSRPDPIPFFGELGSTNPVFVTPSAAAARPDEIAAGFFSAVTASAGQLCTKPGLLFVPEASTLLETLSRAPLPAAHALLNERIDIGFRESLDNLLSHPGVEVLRQSGDSSSWIVNVGIEEFADHITTLSAECFGPASLVVRYEHAADLPEILCRLEGQLTASIFAEEGEVASPLVRSLAAEALDKAGRVIWNQWPTGLSVTRAQQHGGPYPATTDSRFTSVGAAAVERFLRPVTYQNFPDSLLPQELRD